MKLRHLALVASIPFLFACSELPTEPTQPKEEVTVATSTEAGSIVKSEKSVEEKETVNVTYYRVFQVLDNGASLAFKCEHSTESKCRESRDFGYSVVYLPRKIDTMMYDDKIVSVKNPKVVDVYRYQSKNGPKTVPVVVSIPVVAK